MNETALSELLGPYHCKGSRLNVSEGTCSDTKYMSLLPCLVWADERVVELSRSAAKV